MSGRGVLANLWKKEDGGEEESKKGEEGWRKSNSKVRNDRKKKN